MGIRLLAGRDLSNLDVAGAPPVAIVNETIAHKLWPGEPPLGRRFRWNDGGYGPGPWIQVTGIVRDGKYGWLAEDTSPFFYLPFAQSHELAGLPMPASHLGATWSPLSITPYSALTTGRLRWLIWAAGNEQSRANTAA